MTGKKPNTKHQTIDEDSTIYLCPHCKEPFAQGILIHIKANCHNCNKFFVMVGIGVETDK
jgi:hypothetical protein